MPVTIPTAVAELNRLLADAVLPAGKVTAVFAVATKLCVKAPEWLKLPAIVMVFDPLLTPVPPTVPVNGPLIIVLVTVAVSPVVTIVPVIAGTVMVKLEAVFVPLNVVCPPDDA